MGRERENTTILAAREWENTTILAAGEKKDDLTYGQGAYFAYTRVMTGGENEEGLPCGQDTLPSTNILAAEAKTKERPLVNTSIKAGEEKGKGLTCGKEIATSSI